jgi:hypothetical protein
VTGTVDRPQKITFGEMRDTGVHGILIYCADFHCSHSIATSADRWSDDIRLSDLGAPLRLQSLRQARRRCPAGLPLERAAGPGDGLSAAAALTVELATGKFSAQLLGALPFVLTLLYRDLAPRVAALNGGSHLSLATDVHTSIDVAIYGQRRRRGDKG